MDDNGLPPLLAADTPADGLQDIRRFGGNRPTTEAARVRDTYKQYFNAPAGQVPWQYAIVRRGTTNNTQ